MKILIVDDKEENLYLLESLLKGSSHEVTSAKNGMEALERLKRESIDMIISDILMPGMDGIQLSRECKRDDTLRKIPFLFYTATYTDRKDEAFALGLGAERFILKPMEPKRLVEIIEGILEDYKNGLLTPYEIPAEEENGVYLKEYNERLIKKLEDKMLQLESVNRVLGESEKKYKDLIDNANDGVVAVEPTGYFGFVNPKFCEMTGYSMEETKRLHFNKLAHPEDLDMITEHFRGSLAGEETPRSYELRVLTKPGEVLYVELNATPIQREGETVGVQAIIRDITERKLAQEELRKAFEKRKELEDIVNLSPAVVFLWRAAEGWPVEFVSDNVQQFGYRPEDFYSGRILFVNIVHPDDLERIGAEITRYSEEGRNDFVREYRIITNRGEVCWLDDRTLVRRDSNGVITHYQGIVLDITQRKQAEEELKQTLEKLRKAVAGTIRVMALTVERRDPYTAGHQHRVANLAGAIANEIGLSEEQINGVRMASVIHDLGKIHVPAEILSRPGRLTENEFSIIKTHPQIGYDILKTEEFPWPVAQIVLQHHERMDGSGYPSSLSGKEILLEARILAVADVVEAMASHRPYRPALGIDKALEEITENRGVLYDAKVVDACLRLFAEKGFKFE